MAYPWIGFEYTPKKVSWLKRDVLLFNVSIGCKADELHFLYVSINNSDLAWCAAVNGI
jgi:peroxisomal enoyl-CoA hydratase 2